MTCQTFFADESTRAKHPDDPFLSLFRQHNEFDTALLDKRSRRIWCIAERCNSWVSNPQRFGQCRPSSEMLGGRRLGVRSFCQLASWPLLFVPALPHGPGGCRTIFFELFNIEQPLHFAHRML
jgi:hypothetical protein